MSKRILLASVLLFLGAGLMNAQEAYFFNFGSGPATSVPDTGPSGPANLDPSYQYYNVADRPDNGPLGTTIYQANDNSAASSISITTDNGENGDWGDSLIIAYEASGRTGVLDDLIFENYGRMDNRFNTGAFRIRGFEAGTYDIYYVINANGSSTPSASPDSDDVGFGGEGGIYIGVGNTEATNAGTISTSGKTFYDYSNWDNDGTAWVAHDGSSSSTPWNYITQTITVTGPDQWIEFLHTQAGGTANRIGPAALQIVSSAATPPAAPSGLAATPGDASVTLDWDDNAEEGATYSVYRSETEGVYGAALATALANSTYTDNTAANFTTYYYVVTAVVDELESEDSNEVSATPADPSNQAPAFSMDPFSESNALEGTSYSGSIADNASDPDSDPMSFSKVSGPDWLTVAGNGDLSGTPGYADTQTDPNEFVVQVSAAGGTDTATLQITVDVDTATSPNAPAGLTAGAGNAAVTLDWDDNLEGDLESYRVYRTEVSGNYGSPAAPLVTDLASSTYTDTTVTNGTTYFYVVTTVDIHGNESVFSTESSATPSEILDRLAATITQSPGLGGTIDLSGSPTLAWGYATGPYAAGFDNTKSGTTAPTTSSLNETTRDFGYRFTFNDGTSQVSGTAVAASGGISGPPSSTTLLFEDVVSSTERRRLTLYLGAYVSGSATIDIRAVATMTGGTTDRSDYGRVAVASIDTADNDYINAIYTVEFASPTETDLEIVLNFDNQSGARNIGISGYKIETVTGALPPLPVTNLGFTVEDETVNLDWDDSPSGNVTYNVYRSRTSGAYQEPIATGLTSSDYSDTTVQNARYYSYYVTVVDQNGVESDPVAEVVPLPLDPVLAAWTGNVRVFLLGGQSNARGQDDTNRLTDPSQETIPSFEADLYYRTNVIEELYTYSQTDVGMGPEISLGYRLDQLLGGDPNERIVIIKYAEGGTNIANDWEPGGDGTTSGDGTSYVNFQNHVTEGLAFLALKYASASFTIEGMLWQQGESDGTNINNGLNYETDLTNFIADVRATYGSELPFVFGRLSDLQTGVNRNAPDLVPSPLENVQAAQDAVAAADPRSRTFNTDSFGMQSDDLHFTADGLWDIGLEMAREMAYLLYVQESLTSAQIDAGEGEPDADADGDNITNGDEFIQGSSVSNASDRLTPQLRLSGTNEFELSFPSSSNREYVIESSPDLSEGSWQEVGTYAPGSDAMETTTIQSSDPKRFFRVRARLPQ
jgi:fibronectin type 3 domain-containing protein